MAITYNETNVEFSAVVYEDEVISLREYLQEKAADKINFNFIECDDIHLAVLQLVMAYSKSYSASYEFSKETKIYETVLKGFVVSENNCN